MYICGEQLTQRMVGGVPGSRLDHLEGLTFVPEQPVVGTVQASILLCGPATVAVCIASCPMLMAIVLGLPVLGCSMLQVHCMSSLRCTCIGSRTITDPVS